MRTISRALNSLCAALCISGAAASLNAQTLIDKADVPRTFSYQGVLAGVNHTAVPDGQYRITLSLYADPTGTVKIWQDTYDATVVNGVFNLQLGGGNATLPDPGTMDRPLWIGTRIEDTPEMYPLTPLSASPYAMNVADRAITTNKLADGAVTAEKVDMDYLAGIAVNGQPITAKGGMLNIEGSNDITLTFDDQTNTLRLSKPMPATRGDGEKGTDVQGQPEEVWSTGGDGWDAVNGIAYTPVSGDWIGTSSTSGETFVLKTNGEIAMRYQPNGTETPNIVGAYSGNTIGTTSKGSVIAGGGYVNPPTGGNYGNHIHNGNEYSVIGGGSENISEAGNYHATIGGGQGNTIGLRTGTPAPLPIMWATIAGGHGNTVKASHGTIGGGHVNTTTGNGATIAGGSENTASGDNTFIGAGTYNSAGEHNSTIGGGRKNQITNIFSTSISGISATIAGGDTNTATGQAAAIGGGGSNIASYPYTHIGGGGANRATANYAAVAGGFKDTASGDYSFVGGGHDNRASGLKSTIGGGWRNKASGNYSVIAGGDRDTASGGYSFIGGGDENKASGLESAIVGGWRNKAEGLRAFIGGGYGNQISPSTTSHGVISGGYQNVASNNYATVSGGYINTASGTYTTVSGGGWNIASGNYSAIAGGAGNLASGAHSTISGGELNIATARHSTIMGGNQLTVQSYGQSAVGFMNEPRGSLVSQPTAIQIATINDPLFMVGNGTNNTTEISNAFEVSYNGHTTVYGTNGPVTPPMKGATYTDNVLYAWGDINGNGTINNNGSFGITNIVHAPGTGLYTITIRVNDPVTNAQVFLGSAAITATLVNDYYHECGIISVSRLDPATNTFTVRTTRIGLAETCGVYDLPFMFHVTGRPAVQ